VDGLQLVDGIVVPEHSFRKASSFLMLREGRPMVGASLLHPDGLAARHRDGSELKIDVQMRVVKSEKQVTVAEEMVREDSDFEEDFDVSETSFSISTSEKVYALWITYSRHLHSTKPHLTAMATPQSPSGASTPLHQPSPGQTPAHTPMEITPGLDDPFRPATPSTASLLTKQLREVAMHAAAKLTGGIVPSKSAPGPTTATAAQGAKTDKIAAAQPLLLSSASLSAVGEPALKKTIDDFVILEDMGQGAYGQVKLARYKDSGKKVVLKYVTKRRILVDTWTRDRKLGTVPLEIHVLDYLRRPELRHINIVEMEAFFEDDVNYYIEMVPHGLPGMDLFDYIELRNNMEERECRSIFVQVARAIQHLHVRALVVHRDIKDENVILDGEGNIKLIDFGSATYIKSGPFDVFVGTIDYAAPEVLAGKPYGGKEQDVWALGILLYTIIYKENPFYSIDEIMDRDLRVPFTVSPESIDLIRCMLNRNVEQRYTINQVLEHPWFAPAD
jgi:protein-serine/threonine kinase